MTWWKMTAAALTRVELEVSQQGLCAAAEDPDAWFPNERAGGPLSDRGREASLDRAAAMCAGCPVLAQCRRAALNGDDVDGIRGGLPAWALGEIRKAPPVVVELRRGPAPAARVLGVGGAAA